MLGETSAKLLWGAIQDVERMAGPGPGPGADRRPGRAGQGLLVDKLRADAGLASVVYLAALKLDDDDSVELDAIVGQLRRLSGRLEKRAAQADRLNVAGGEEGRDHPRGVALVKVADGLADDLQLANLLCRVRADGDRRRPGGRVIPAHGNSDLSR